MSLVSPVRPVEYTGDGAKKRYTFPFPYDNKKDVVVELDSNGTWIEQSEGGSYRFVNDNTIEFKVAPKNKIKISRKTYSRKVVANKFATSRPECEVVDITCRGNTDGTNGTITDDRDEALRPYKVGDTITYTSPCDDGANVYWYTTPTSGGSATLIRTDHLRGLTKTTSLTLEPIHIDKRISVKIKCLGCGPPDGLCCEWTVNTDNDVLKDDVCGLNAVIGSADSKVLHNIQDGYGVIKLTLTSPDVGRIFNVTFPDGTSYNYTVGGGSTPSAEKVIPKPDDSAYVIITVPNASGKGWQYSLRCTEGVDTSKYSYVRWVGSSIKYRGSYTTIWGIKKPSSTSYDIIRQTNWLEYNPGTKTDGYATINGPGYATFSSWGGPVMTYGPFYIGDRPWDDVYNYQVVPWRSAYTQRGAHNGHGIYIGSLSINSKGSPNSKPNGNSKNATYAVHRSAFTKDSYTTVAGYWEFSNDTAIDKVVEARWDGDRSYTTDSELPNLTDLQII